jgi:DNA-binding beta-propeller fold protein YncE
MRKSSLLLLLLPLPLLACDKDASKGDTTTKPAATATSSAAPSLASAAPLTSAAAAVPAGPKPVFHIDNFQTPESVLYDDANDHYLVSNINGAPSALDNNGYIEMVHPEGMVVEERWIQGGKNKVTLNAPKGMAISSRVLYVADIDTVRMFDLNTGAPKGDIKIPGATFLNDIAVNPVDGSIYVSDSGLKAGDKGELVGSGTDAVYVIEKGKARALAKDAEKLGRPNGLVAGPTGVWVVTFGSGELYRLDAKGEKQDAIKLPKGTLDGIVMMGDSLFISSWEASGVYEGTSKGPFSMKISGVKSPADIGFDTKRSRVLVPLFKENAVEAYDIK